MESELHKKLKQAVARELHIQQYTVYHEPPEPPLSRLFWYSYRPDVIGVISNNSKLIILVVECETNPSLQRMLRKTNQIKHVFYLQKCLNEDHLILPLLIIPSMKFNKINFLEIRRFWEIWIINNSGKILHKLSRINCIRKKKS